jgi:hypothetical protein
MTITQVFQTMPEVFRFCRRTRGELMRASGEHMFWRAMFTRNVDVGRKLAAKATERIIEGCEVIQACEKEKKSRPHD